MELNETHCILESITSIFVNTYSCARSHRMGLRIFFVETLPKPPQIILLLLHPKLSLTHVEIHASIWSQIPGSPPINSFQPLNLLVVPWSEHSPSKSSSFTPLETSIYYELAHKCPIHLLHVTTNVITSKKYEGNFFSKREKVIATSFYRLTIST